MKLSKSITALVLVLWLIFLTGSLARHSYRLSILEKRTAVQMGMSVSEASTAWGRSPHVWQAGTRKISDNAPASMRNLKTGTFALFSDIWPSSYLWVHFNEKGYADQTFFLPS